MGNDVSKLAKTVGQLANHPDTYLIQLLLKINATAYVTYAAKLGPICLICKDYKFR